MQELIDLTHDLMSNTNSRLHAAVAGWDRPVSPEWIIAADTYDLLHASKSKRRPKPYPRPWPENKTKIGGKKKVKRSIKDVRAILRPHTTE